MKGLRLLKLQKGILLGTILIFLFSAAQPQVAAAGSADFIVDFGISRFVAYVSIFHKNSQILQFVFKEHTVPRSFDGALAMTNKRNNEWQSQFTSNSQIHVGNPERDLTSVL